MMTSGVSELQRNAWKFRPGAGGQSRAGSTVTVGSPGAGSQALPRRKLSVAKGA